MSLLRRILYGRREFLRIKQCIFQVEAIATVSTSYNSLPPASYEVLVNYNGGPTVVISFETKDESEKALDKISKALKAK